MTAYRPVPGTVEYKTMRRRQWICIGAALGLLLVLSLAAAYICLFRRVPLQISRETTCITGPLKSDGLRVDYLAAWEQETYPKDIATDRNGYRLLVAHLGTVPHAPTWHAAQIFQKLGLSGEPRPDMTFEGPDDFLEAWLESDDCDDELVGALVNSSQSGELLEELQEWLYRPWTLDELPMMAPWLEENGPALDLIVEVSQKPTFRIPLAEENEDRLLIELLLPEVQQARAFARGLSVRANHRIATGDIDGAIGDVLACKRYGRQVGHGSCLVQMLVGVAIEGIADAVGIAGSLEHPPARQQLQRLVDGLNDLPLAVEFEEAMRFERYMTLDYVQALAHGHATLDDWGITETVPRGIGFDWNLVARRVNAYFDSIPNTSTTPQLTWDWRAFASLRVRSEYVAERILGAWDIAQEVHWRRTCSDRMHGITLAMLLHQADHGTLPAACTVDENGNPLHSWRVALLPYLGQQELYDRIRLDERWDSQFNRQFHKEAIECYQCPSAELAAGETTYAVIVGPDMPFEEGKAKTLDNFGPMSTNMILLVERAEAVCWMDPESDVSQVAAEAGLNNEGAAVASPHPGGVIAGFRNGGVRFVSEVVEEEQFKAMLRGTADRIP